MSDLFDKMMAKNGYQAPPVKLDPRRAELASAITKKFINASMPDIQAVLGQVKPENKGGKPE